MTKVIIGKRLQTSKIRREWNMASKNRKIEASEMLGYSPNNGFRSWSQLSNGMKKDLIRAGFRYK